MSKQLRLIYGLGLLAILLSIAALVINQQVLHYHGVNYFPNCGFRTGVTLGLLFSASYIHSGLHSKITQIIIHIIIFYVLLGLIILMTTAAQYTPYSTIDHWIVKNEPWDILPLIHWTQQHPDFRKILALIYNSLNDGMVILPIFSILVMRTTYFYEYIILVLITGLLGFGFYYFYPSSGPASVLPAEYFGGYQFDTGIKFRELHHHLPLSTNEGGLIALPSFHVLWTWLTIYSVRCFRFLFYLLLPYFVMMVSACILLGWHFFIDIIGSIMILLLAHGFCIMYGATAKRRKTRSKDHTRIDQIPVLNDPFF